MEAATTQEATLAVGAPVVAVPGSSLIHIPSVYRLGPGGYRGTIRSMMYAGSCPVVWTSVCGKRGTVLFYRGPLLEAAHADFITFGLKRTPGLCPDCLRPTVTLLFAHDYDPPKLKPYQPDVQALLR